MRGSLLFILALFFGFISSAFSEEPLRVGFIGSLSGVAQMYGTACKNGLEMGLDEFGREGIEVFYEDDQFLPAKTVSAFKKLTDINDADIVIVIGSTPSNAVAALAQQKRIPLFAWASDTRVSRGKSFVMRSYPSGKAEGEKAAKEALRRELKKFAVLISTNDYALSWRSGVVASLPKEEVFFDEEVTGEGSDFRALVLKVKKLGVKTVALCLDPGKSGLFAKQSKELSGPEVFFGCEYLHDRSEVDLSEGGLIGAWFSTVQVREDFKKRYIRRFDNENILSGAANHYDIASILSKVKDKGRGQRLLDAVLSLGDREGAVGDFRIQVTPEDRFFDINLTVLEVKKDGLKVVKESR